MEIVIAVTVQTSCLHLKLGVSAPWMWAHVALLCCFQVLSLTRSGLWPLAPGFPLQIPVTSPPPMGPILCTFSAVGVFFPLQLPELRFVLRTRGLAHGWCPEPATGLRRHVIVCLSLSSTSHPPPAPLK